MSFPLSKRKLNIRSSALVRNDDERSRGIEWIEVRLGLFLLDPVRTDRP